MTNEEKAREYQAFIVRNNPSADAYDFFNAYLSGCQWKDRQFEWNERMHEQAVNQNLTNKEFREMLEKLPDDALICVECCHPRAMIYDEKYNLIRID